MAGPNLAGGRVKLTLSAFLVPTSPVLISPSTLSVYLLVTSMAAFIKNCSVGGPVLVGGLGATPPHFSPSKSGSAAWVNTTTTKCNRRSIAEHDVFTSTACRI